MGIPGVGEATAKDLATFFGSTEAMLGTHAKTLQFVPNIGADTANAIFKFLDQPSNVEVIRRLLSDECGVRPRLDHWKPPQLSLVAFLEIFKVQGVGNKSAMRLADVYRTPQALALATAGELSVKVGLRDIVGSTLLTMLRQPEAEVVLAELKRLGAQFVAMPGQTLLKNEVGGKTFVLTGTHKDF